MSDKYTKSARGQECQIRIPSICNRNSETVVFAHIGGGGMGMKRNSLAGSYACSSCHDAVDGRTPTEFKIWSLQRMHLEGMLRTQEIMIKDGVLVL